MASSEMNQDMFIDILSRCFASVVGKCRILNQDCNKRTYSSSFLKLNLQRTSCISGYFLQYHKRLTVHSAFFNEGGDPGNIDRGSEISLDFLPKGRERIEACDASHGILLCVNEPPVHGRGPFYIVCKPTTKQYLIIPKPKTRYFAIASGLMVIGSDPLRYKILRLSELPSREQNRYNYNYTLVCEVFDSDLSAWKRLKNVELPEKDLMLSRLSNPVASYGFLHYLTAKNNVFRFCFKTETWSIFPVPENILGDEYGSSLRLARYEGKLGVIRLRSRWTKDVVYHQLWVLESSFGNSWVHVKDIKTIGGIQPVGFSSNDVVTLAAMDRICLYNTSNEKTRNLQIRSPKFSLWDWYHSDMVCFPLFSDHKRVEFRGSGDPTALNRTSYNEGQD